MVLSTMSESGDKVFFELERAEKSLYSKQALQWNCVALTDR